jgi:dihydroorotate dehydrogenase (fumarate)
MDLSTSYLGLTLSNPLIAGASPLADELDGARRLEDAGVAAIVMRSIFEEQIEAAADAAYIHTSLQADSFAEGLHFVPPPDAFALSLEAYLEQIDRAKAHLGIPIIGSLNGTAPGAWISCAAAMEQAGADAIEINANVLPVDPRDSGSVVEERILGMARAVRDSVTVPVAVKLLPAHTSLPHLARRLEDVGVDGLVLFDRLVEPNVEIEGPSLTYSLPLSSGTELPLRLRWVSLLAGQVDTSLAVTGGVHTASDVAKALLCGADAVQMVSALVSRGVVGIRGVLAELERWLQRRGAKSIREMKGKLVPQASPDPGGYERREYMLALQARCGVHRPLNAREE